MSEIKPETQSNWECVSNQLKNSPPLILGDSTSEWFYNKSDFLLNYLTHYKFASKLIGKEKKVLDISCGEGMGTYLIAKECGFAKGMDLDSRAIEIAGTNFFEKNITFEKRDFFNNPPESLEKWDAIISFGALFSISFNELLNSITKNISNKGIVILGISFQSNERNISEDELRSAMDLYFTHTFLFSIYGEMIQAGYQISSEGLIVVGCKKRIIP